ncbi:MAG: ComEA family DNA-binding protein [Microbacteriaceae bacterium]
MTRDLRTAAPARPRFRAGLGAVVVLLIGGLSVAVVASGVASSGTGQAILPRPQGSTVASPATAVFVQVVGAVNRPGLYRLRDGDRAVDAIAAAGGYSASADRSQLNLARFLSDGEQIHVPAVGEAPPPGKTIVPGVLGGKVNLNTADSTTLQTLPGVGPAMAQRIVAWREKNGRFSSIKDLLSVTGIGDKKFAELKSLVTV